MHPPLPGVSVTQFAVYICTPGKSVAVYIVIPVDSDGLDFTKKEDVITAVSNALKKEKHKDEFIADRTRITGITYFEGDYSATCAYINDLTSNAKNGTAKYSLVFRNCAHSTWFAMAQSNKKFLLIPPITIPNVAYAAINVMKFLFES